MEKFARPENFPMKNAYRNPLVAEGMRVFGFVSKFNRGIKRVREQLEAHQSPKPSHWREDAQWRRDNEYWLKHSRYITLQVMRAMDEQSVTQVELAKRMGCTQQYASNLLKGSSNMTLETIARLEKALNIDLIKFVDGYKHRKNAKK